MRIRIRKLCKPLEEDAFRPVLHHYDGPKFRLELSIAEVCRLLLLLCTWFDYNVTICSIELHNKNVAMQTEQYHLKFTDLITARPLWERRRLNCWRGGCFEALVHIALVCCGRWFTMFSCSLSASCWLPPARTWYLKASNTCACLYCAVRNLEDVYVLLFMYFGRVHPEGNPKMGGYCNAS